MPTLMCFGLGYAAEHFIAAFGDGFDRITGTVRGIERAADLNSRFAGQVKVLAFDGKSASAEAKEAAANADAALVSIPQTETGDPVLAAFGEEVAQARDRFQAGVANNLEVITAQDELARANDNQIGALYRYNQSRADLAHAVGQMEALYAR